MAKVAVIVVGFFAFRQKITLYFLFYSMCICLFPGTRQYASALPCSIARGSAQEICGNALLAVAATSRQTGGSTVYCTPDE